MILILDPPPSEPALQLEGALCLADDDSAATTALVTIEMSLSKARSKGGRPAITSDDQFPVSQCMVDDMELPLGQLAVDVEIKHGQIRLLNVLRGEALKYHFIVNPSHKSWVDLSPGPSV